MVFNKNFFPAEPTWIVLFRLLIHAVASVRMAEHRIAAFNLLDTAHFEMPTWIPRASRASVELQLDFSLRKRYFQNEALVVLVVVIVLFYLFSCQFDTMPLSTPYLHQVRHWCLGFRWKAVGSASNESHQWIFERIWIWLARGKITVIDCGVRWRKGKVICISLQRGVY